MISDEKYRQFVAVEVRKIMDMSDSQTNLNSPILVTEQQVEEAIMSINRGKAQASHGVRIEHFFIG